MFFYLLLLFTLLPFVELALLLEIHGAVGLLPTLALVFGTGVLGAALARWQGLRTLGRIREEMASGQVPGDALVDGMLILVAGAVLLTPGVLTDAFGFALLIPPLRNLFKRGLRRWFQRHVRIETTAFTTRPDPAPRDRVIDVEVTGTRVVEEE